MNVRSRSFGAASISCATCWRSGTTFVVGTALGALIFRVGLDTPERGQCGYDMATQNAASIVSVGSSVTLTAVSSKDDTDKYDRLLRYVTVSDGTDLGLEQIRDGLADARYDSRDGYGAHPKEALQIAADTTSNSGIGCMAAPAPIPTTPAPATAPDPAQAGGPWNMPGPDLNCSDIRQKVRITGPDYHHLEWRWRRMGLPVIRIDVGSRTVVGAASGSHVMHA